MALSVSESGPATAPTLVFLHGGGISGWMWRPQVEALADYHCLVPDLPEHGQSAEVKPLSINAAVARVVDLIRNRAHGGRAHVVGLSLGGQIATQLLAAAPEVMDHAVVSGTLARPMPGARLLAPSVDVMYRLYAPFKDAGWPIRLNMQSSGIPERYFVEVREDTRRLTAEALAHVLDAGLSPRLPAGLERAKVPALVLVGQKEYGIVRQSARDLVQALPNAKAYIAPKVGHAWNLQDPELFTRTVRAWITDQPLPQELLPLT